MKNKILYFLFLIFIPTLALSNELELKASQIESYDKGNLIKGFDGITVIDGQDLIITAEEFEFDKIKSILQIFGNTIIVGLQGDALNAKNISIYIAFRIVFF